MAGTGVPSSNAQTSGSSQSSAGTSLLHADQAATAAAWNNSHWDGDFRAQLIAFLRNAPVDHSAVFGPAEAQHIASYQDRAGATVDGMIGTTTTAVLLHCGLTLSHPPAADPNTVTIEFYPGELEDLTVWQERMEAASADGRGYRDVQPPPGTGRLYVHVNGRLVAKYTARGGPPTTMPDGRDHSAGPTAHGVYALGPGHPIVTSSWPYSQIPWGAEIRKVGENYQFQPEGAKDWTWASGPHCTLSVPLDSDDFDSLEQISRNGQTALLWNKNDFGKLGWRLTGTADFIHTTPDTELASLRQGKVVLAPSHGCVHVIPAERDEMIARGYLQGGVKIDVKAYHEHMLPDRLRETLSGS